MVGRGGDLVPDLGRRGEAPAQERARRGEEPLRLGSAAAGAGAGAGEGGEAPRESPAPGHLSPERDRGRAGGRRSVELGEKVRDGRGERRWRRLGLLVD
jgi:hypothetical protein